MFIIILDITVYICTYSYFVHRDFISCFFYRPHTQIHIVLFVHWCLYSNVNN